MCYSGNRWHVRRTYTKNERRAYKVWYVDTKQRGEPQDTADEQRQEQKLGMVEERESYQ